MNLILLDIFGVSNFVQLLSYFYSCHIHNSIKSSLMLRLQALYCFDDSVFYNFFHFGIFIVIAQF